MIVNITHREIREGAKGDYLYIKYVTAKGKESGKAVFSQLRDKWDLCQENASVDLILDEKYNVTDINPIETPPPIEPKLRPEDEKIVEDAIKPQPSGPEVGLWWKQLGDDLRSGHIDKTTPQGKLLRAAYFAQMFSVLKIKIDKEE